MRLDLFRLFSLATRVQEILRSSPQEVSVPRGDTGLYLAARALAEQLERTNPGIYSYAGYSQPINVANAAPTTLDNATPGVLPDAFS